jgi:hypothetical protein
LKKNLMGFHGPGAAFTPRFHAMLLHFSHVFEMDAIAALPITGPNSPIAMPPGKS